MLTKFMACLAAADAVRVSGELLHTWGTEPLTGEHDNEVAQFSWVDTEYHYSANFTEEGISTGSFNPETNVYTVFDHEGDPVDIEFFRLVPVVSAE